MYYSISLGISYEFDNLARNHPKWYSVALVVVLFCLLKLHGFPAI